VEKLIITVATTGGQTTRERTPYLPLSPEEIADEVYRSWEAGASIAHIHVRGDDGSPSMDTEKFRRVVNLVRERCDIILNLTSSGGLIRDEDERIRPIAELAPELASFDAGSINFGRRVFLNAPDFLDRLAAVMLEKGVKPEIEVFDTGMIANALALVSNGLLREPLHFQFVVGVAGGMPATPRGLLHLVESIPPGSTWSAIGVGRAHLPIASMALHMGGHIRVGMEDNVYYRKGVLARSNAEFVSRIVDLAEVFERPVATPTEARAILGLGATRPSVKD